MYRFAWVVSCLLLLYSCGTKNEKKLTEGATAYQKTEYAKGFYINPEDSEVVVTSPWQGISDYHLCYYKSDTILKSNDHTMTVAIPKKINRIITFSTTHIGFLRALGEDHKLVGISGTKYVNDPTIRKRINSGEIQDVGYDRSLNEELIISLKPDIIFAYGVGSEVMELYQRFKKFNIPVVIIGEYSEMHPLGKLEWIKVFGYIFGKENQAQKIYTDKREKYNNLKSLVSKDSLSLPLVMTGFPYKDSWWMSGSKTTTAQFIRDAGGEYLWSNHNTNKSFPVAFEEVYMKSAKADYWIDCGSMRSRSQILDSDPRFRSFKPWKENHIFNNNKRLSEEGGNDFWESGVITPELILGDLIAIFHPQLMPNHSFYYYTKLK